MIIIEFNPASKEATPENLVKLYGHAGVEKNGLVVRCDYDHPITKKAYARAFMVSDVTFLFAMLHDETDRLVTAKLSELIGLAMLRENDHTHHPDIVRWLRAKTNITEHRSSIDQMALLVDLKNPLDFLDGQE